MEATALPELLILVLGIGVCVVGVRGVSLLVELVRHRPSWPTPATADPSGVLRTLASVGPGKGAATPLLVAVVVSLLLLVGVAAIATYVVLSEPAGARASACPG